MTAAEFNAAFHNYWYAEAMYAHHLTSVVTTPRPVGRMAFMKAIRKDPNSTQLRLVYADYLEENELTFEAEMIRVMCAGRCPVRVYCSNADDIAEFSVAVDRGLAVSIRCSHKSWRNCGKKWCVTGLIDQVSINDYAPYVTHDETAHKYFATFNKCVSHSIATGSLLAQDVFTSVRAIAADDPNFSGTDESFTIKGDSYVEAELGMLNYLEMYMWRYGHGKEDQQ